MAQIRITLGTPHQLASGRLVMDLDPALFGPIAAVDVFSATGDQVGVANIQGRHLDTQFASPTGGIGRIPAMPFLTITVPVLATATNGATASIAFTAGNTVWKDVQGNQYLPSAPPAQMQLGGALSVATVTPGGGILPAGANVHITGTGFSPATTVQIDGVVLASKSSAGSQTIDIVLGGPADLTGKRVVVRNPDGAQADFFAALRGTYLNQVAGLQPIFPQQTYTGATLGDTAYGYALENQTLSPVDVQLTNTAEDKYATSGRGVITIPAGGIYMFQHFGPASSVSAATTTPVRMMSLAPSLPHSIPPPFPQAYVTWDGGSPRCAAKVGFPFPSEPGCYAWLIGSPLPPFTLTVSFNGSFTAEATTTDGGAWLSVTTGQATSCSYNVCTTVAKLTLKVDPSALTVGEYTGTITVTAIAPNAVPTVVPFTFRVTRSIISVAGPNPLQFATDLAHTPPPPRTLQVTSTGDPAPFTVKVPGSFVSVTPLSGTTPATLTVTADPSVLTAANPGPSGVITISGPANSVDILTGLDAVSPPRMYTDQTSFTFWAKTGAPNPAAQFFDVFPFPPDKVTTATDDGQDWLLASVSYARVSLTANPSGLSPGTYHGSITVASTAHSDYPPAQVDVTFIVWSDPPLVSAEPATVELSTPSGSSTRFLVTLTSGSLPVDFTLSASTDDGNPWLTVGATAQLASSYIGVMAQNLPPGTYHGKVFLTGPAGSSHTATVPVTLNVTNATPPLPQPGPPLGVSILNAASQTPGAISPGEIVTILGLNIGPPNAASVTLDPDGKVSTNLGGSRVLFDDVPAPLLYASATQVNAIVPFARADKQVVTVTMEYNGVATIAAGAPLVPASPSISANSVNQDGSANSPSNPAIRGSMLTLFATGLGRVKRPLSITIGALTAVIQDVSETYGVVQLRVLIPPGIAPGPSIPVTLTVDSGRTSNTVTIAVY